jgi:transcriptional regulator with GAF, ATPase, and Fis domain
VELNCAAIPSELLESELFGHEKGAFTDAKTQKAGLLESADGGTLFLDEIGEMSLPLQVKLLKVLEAMTFRRVGGTRDITVNVRVVSATNRDLESLCADGRFRDDLYFRLKVVPIHVPPLRERDGDILIFAKHFLHAFSKQFGKRFHRIHPEAERKLLDYTWPGNIRELRNLFERTVLLEDGDELQADQLALSNPSATRTAPRGRPAGVSALPSAASEGEWVDPDSPGGDLLRRLYAVIGRRYVPPSGIAYEELVGAVERELILAACEESDWNQSRTAELLQLGRDKLRYRMKLHGISVRSHRRAAEPTSGPPRSEPDDTSTGRAA